MSHVRHLPLFGFVGAPLAAWLLREMWEDEGGGRARVLRWLLPVGVGVCGLWLLFFPGEALYMMKEGRRGAGPSTLAFNRQLARGEAVTPGAYPEEAVHFVLRARLPGRMYNRNNYSGYLIWRLSPEHYKVFTDSRFDIFGQDFLMDELSVVNGWEDGFLINEKKPREEWLRVGRSLPCVTRIREVQCEEIKTLDIYSFGIGKIDRMMDRALSLNVIMMVNDLPYRFQTSCVGPTAGVRFHRLRIPETIEAIQRRAYYRVAPPHSKALQVRVRFMPEEDYRVVEVIDVSVGGIMIYDKTLKQAPAENQKVALQLKFDDGRTFAFNGLVRHCTPFPMNNRGLRVGLQFESLTPSEEIALGHTVMRWQRMKRRTALV